MNGILCGFDTGAELILDGDLLLYRAPSHGVGRIIAWAGRGAYSHAAIAGWWGHTLMSIGMREFRGGIAVPLKREVSKYPQRIDVYTVNGPICPYGAVEAMKSLLGNPYGWRSIWRAIGIRLGIVVPCTDDDDQHVQRDCSAAVSYAYRVGGGADPVPELADCDTEPSDLARSRLFSYRFTLI